MIRTFTAYGRLDISDTHDQNQMNNPAEARVYLKWEDITLRGGEMKEYEIKTLMDFTKVPKEKLSICLNEFAEWVQIMRNAEKLCKDTLKPVEKFVWIDDKQRNITINIIAPTSGKGE